MRNNTFRRTTLVSDKGDPFGLKSLAMHTPSTSQAPSPPSTRAGMHPLSFTEKGGG
jgi:hypothetical protein